MIDMHLKYDNMHKNGMFYALICINNHVIACLGCMLSRNALEACKGMWQCHLGHHGPEWGRHGAKDKLAKWIRPMGIVGPVSIILRGAY